VPQPLAHDVEDGVLSLGARPRLRRADASLVDVGQQRDVRLAVRGHLGHGPPAEHPSGDIAALQQFEMLVPLVLADLHVQLAHDGFRTLQGLDELVIGDQ